MKRHHQHKPEPITDEFAQAVARKLESRGIVRVPGLPTDEPEWFDVAIEHHRRQQELAAEREARRQAEEVAQETLQTTASILIGEIAKAATGSGSAANAGSEADPLRAGYRTALPLNGAAVLRAALSGGSGTVNGGHA
jgi:hypothetical protein